MNLVPRGANAWAATASLCAVAAVTLVFSAPLPLALLIGAGVAATFQSPRSLFVVWLVAICVTPSWAGVDRAAFWEAGTLISVLVLPGLGFHLAGTQIALNLGDALIGMLLLTVALGTAIGHSPVGQTSDFIFVGLVPYAIARFLVPTRIGFDWTFRAITAAMCVFAFAAIIELALDIHPLTGTFPDSPTHFWSEIQYRNGFSRSEVSFGHSLALGGCLAMAVPLAISSSYTRNVKIGAVVLLSLGVLSTQSRAAMIATVLGLLLTLYVRYAGRTRARAVILTSTFAVLLIVTAFFVFFYTDRESVDSVIHRSNLYTELFSDFNPIGIADGFAISDGSAALSGERVSIDSSLLQIGLLYGWAAVLITVIGLSVPVHRVLTSKAQAPDIVLASQLPVLLTVWLITQYYPMVWVLIGLVVAASPASRYKQKVTLPLSFNGRPKNELSEASDVASDSNVLKPQAPDS